MLSAGETNALNSRAYDHLPYEIPGGSNVEDSGISEYLEFKQEVENKLRCAQAELVSNRRKLVACDETLLDRYDKLFNLVVDRPERDKAREQKYEADKVAKARLEEMDYKQKLLEEITSLSEERQHSELAVESSQLFLADFLQHNATILNSVVKAEAQDTERRRKAHRKQAHDLIIEGLQGTTSPDCALSASAAMERQMSLETSRSSQLRVELEKLRDHEEMTDALVDQLRIKVESIDLLEESQVQLITNQVSQQRKLGVRIKELGDMIEKHNDELEVITQNVRIEIFDKIDAMMGGKTMTAMSCCITLLMIFVIVGVTYYVVSEFYY